MSREQQGPQSDSKNPLDRPRPMPRKGFRDGVFQNETPCNPQKPQCSRSLLVLLPIRAGNVAGECAGAKRFAECRSGTSRGFVEEEVEKPRARYKEISKISRADILLNTAPNGGVGGRKKNREEDADHTPLQGTVGGVWFIYWP